MDIKEYFENKGITCKVEVIKLDYGRKNWKLTLKKGGNGKEPEETLKINYYSNPNWKWHPRVDDMIEMITAKTYVLDISFEDYRANNVYEYTKAEMLETYTQKLREAEKFKDFLGADGLEQLRQIVCGDLIGEAK